MPKSILDTSSGGISYTLEEINNIIDKFHEKHPGCMGDEHYQNNLNNKLLYICRDLLIRIQYLEHRNTLYKL
jgi:hypothetical protein